MGLGSNMYELYDNSILWQMSAQERIAFFYVMESSRRELALEVGSYKGGSLQHLNRYFKEVISLDIDHAALDPKVKTDNVTLIGGDSRKTLPELIKHMNENREELNFVLIDGNHEYEYVLSDLESVLDYVPVNETTILIHDSWYLPSRQAICASKKLRECKYVHFVDTDFCSGTMMNKTTCIGGFCLIKMTSKQRTADLVINQSHDLTFRTLYKLP